MALSVDRPDGRVTISGEAGTVAEVVAGTPRVQVRADGASLDPLRGGGVTVTRPDGAGVAVLPSPSRAVRIGVPGPQGTPGTTDGTTYLATAVGAVGGGRVVRAVAGGVSLADASDPSHAGAVVGISEQAAADGETLLVRVGGRLSDSGWSWAPGAPLFFDSLGRITASAPVTGFAQRVATALSATEILIDIDTGVILHG